MMNAPLRPAVLKVLRRWRWLLVLAVLAALAGGVGLAERSARHARERAEALRLSERGDFAVAEVLLKRALERDGNDVMVLRALALGYLGTERGKEAETCLNRWCALQPNRPEPHARRMELFLGLGRLDQALAEAERVLELEPTNLVAQQHVVILLMQNGRPAEAERASRGFLQRRPARPELLYLLAQAGYEQGKGEEAAGILDSLLRQNPRDTEALMLRAILYCEAGQDDRAVPLLRQVLEQAPSHRMARYHLSQALARTGRAEDARHEMAEVLRQERAERVLDDLRVQPDNVDLQVRAAESLLSSGRADEGRRLLERVLARDPHHAAALRVQAAYREQRP